MTTRCVLEPKNVIHRELIARVEIHIGQTLQLTEAPVEHPAPGRKPRQARLEAQPAAECVLRLRRARPSSRAAQALKRALKARRAAAHNQHCRIARRGLEALRVPAAPPFLADRRVLRATHRHAVMPARDADVAADALADVLLPALVDLARQKRIGNGRPRRTDEIEHTRA